MTPVHVAPSATQHFVEHDRRFRAVIGSRPRLCKVASTDVHEGPVYVDGAFYATTTRGPDRPTAIVRIALDGSGEVHRLGTDAAMPNGMTLGPDGHLIVCEQGDMTRPACISRIHPVTGRRSVLADSWRGEPLNSPNDATVDADGAIWFTDPSYGHLQGFRPPPRVGDHVYRIDPWRGTCDVVADGFDKPNGIALSPDARTLYVTDSGADHGDGSIDPARRHHVEAFDVVAGRLSNRRLLAVTWPGIPDGLKVDEDGRVYVSSDTGVLVLDPDGRLLGEILVDGAVNFAFGGPGRNVLYILGSSLGAAPPDPIGIRGAVAPSAAPCGRSASRIADTALWAAELAVAGPAAVPVPPPLTIGVPA